MFSIDCAVNAQIANAELKAFAASVPVELNNPEGIVASDEQLYQAAEKVVALEKSKEGKDVRPDCLHVLSKFVPLEVSITGNDVKLEQTQNAR